MTDVQHSLRTWKARFRATSALLEIDAARGLTIGQFYSLISNMIGEVGDKAFINPPRNQIGPALMPDAVIVTNVATAQQARQSARSSKKEEARRNRRPRWSGVTATRITTASCKSSRGENS